MTRRSLFSCETSAPTRPWRGPHSRLPKRFRCRRNRPERGQHQGLRIQERCLASLGTRLPDSSHASPRGSRAFPARHRSRRGLPEHQGLVAADLLARGVMVASHVWRYHGVGTPPGRGARKPRRRQGAQSSERYEKSTAKEAPPRTSHRRAGSSERAMSLRISSPGRSMPGIPQATVSPGSIGSSASTVI